MASEYLYEAKANAKVTWTFDILQKLPSGYHEIEGLMQEIDYFDTIYLRSNCKGNLVVSSTSPELPTDSSNLAWKAARELQEYCQVKHGVDIHIVKRIPIGGGLGGGSSDAAAVIRGLNHIWGLGLPDSEMLHIAQKVGMDTCFSTIGGVALVRGRGEFVRAVTIDREFQLVVANPGFPILTREAYADLDLKRVGKMQHSARMLAALENGDHNDFESSILERVPVLSEIKRVMLDHGITGALLSGSGSSVFGIIPPDVDGESLRKTLNRLCPLVVLTRTINRRSGSR